MESSRRGRRMSRVDMELQLLLCAIGNVIDQNKDVEHITIPEIWEWLNDIIAMRIDEFNSDRAQEEKE
jgi:hypothetical protein